MRRHSGILTWAAAALAVAALAGCSTDTSAAPSSGGRQLTGTFTLTATVGVPDPCAPLRGHEDLDDGALVAVFDTTGNLLTTGSLGTGDAQDGSCVHSIDVPAVADLDAYRVTIGSYGPIEVSRESLDEAGGTLNLHFGG